MRTVATLADCDKYPGYTKRVRNTDGSWTLYYPGDAAPGEPALPTVTPIDVPLVTPQKYGAVANGSTNDTAALNSAIAEAKLIGARLVGRGIYRITSTVDFRGVNVDFGEASIYVAHAGVGIMIGGNASLGDNPEQRFHSVTRASGVDAYATPTIRCVGAKGQTLYVGRCGHFQMWADTTPAVNTTDYSSGYSSLTLRYLDTLEITNNAATSGSPVQWINENSFWLNRVKNIKINGTYGHNNNVFRNGNMEDGSSIVIEGGAASNKFHNLRLEGDGNSITFGAGTRDNLVVQSWSRNNTASEEIGVNATVVNLGLPSNRAVRTNTAYLATTTVYAASVWSPRVDQQLVIPGSTYPSRPRPSVKRLTAQRDFAPVDISDVFRVYAGDYIEIGTDAGLYRPTVYFFDASMRSVAAVAGDCETLAYVVGDAIAPLSDVPGITLQIRSSKFAFAQVVLDSGTAADNSGWSWKVTITNDKLRTSDRAARSFHRDIVSAKPTSGFALLGHVFRSAAGGEIYTCTLSVDAVSTSPAASGAASISVQPASSLAVSPLAEVVSGDVVGIELPNGTHWTTAVSMAGSVLNFSAPLPADVPAGSRVTICRWVTS